MRIAHKRTHTRTHTARHYVWTFAGGETVENTRHLDNSECTLSERVAQNIQSHDPAAGHLHISHHHTKFTGIWLHFMFYNI